MKMSNLCPKRSIRQMSPRHVRLRTFGAVWHKKLTREAKTEQPLICRIECKMKEFDTNFVESLLEGVKARVRSIGDNGVYALFK